MYFNGANTNIYSTNNGTNKCTKLTKQRTHNVIRGQQHVTGYRLSMQQYKNIYLIIKYMTEYCNAHSGSSCQNYGTTLVTSNK